jgi:alpha-N-arabinofuranosidase
MKKTCLIPVIALAILSLGCNRHPSTVKKMNITSLEPVARISPLIYGHFFEHIYHSANGGLWGDRVWNRSFEEYLDKPDWKVSGGILSQSARISDVKMLLGDPSWTDYDFTVDARKDGGYEGFLLLFRALDDHNFYWLNLGGWGNSQHAVEKETDNRREVVTPFVSGRIQTKKWVKIRVSVRGNRISAWLEGQPVIQFTDTINPFLRGEVGLGSWSTAVSYRNLKVTRPDGTILYSGLPKIKQEGIFPRHWSSSSNSSMTVMNQDALNGDFYLHVRVGKDPISLVQEKMAVKKGDTLKGSLWLKGDPGVTVTLSLVGKNRAIASCLAGSPEGGWKEYPVSLSPSDSDDNAALAITFSGKGNAAIDQVSLMSTSDLRNDGFRTDLYEAVNGIRPTVIRWPGGCYAELYRWKSGIGPQYKRIPFPENIWDDRDVNSLGTDEFMTLCRKLGSEPLLVINSGFHEGAGSPESWQSWIREACEWVEYCNGPATSGWGAVRAANGHPAPYGVKFWEIDNELWRSRVPDPHKYSSAVKLFAAAMRKVDPSITIIAHGGNGTDMEWNRVLLEECAPDFDILSIHHYSDPNGYYTAARAQDSLYKLLKTAIASSPNPAIKVYVSEWNAQSTDWRTGLYAGNLLNVFERNPEVVTLAGPALFLRHTSAPSWDNAFINFDQAGWFPAPNYVVMKLWREHFAPDRLNLDGIPDSVNAVASYDPEGRRLVVKIVNNSHSSQDLEIRLPEGFRAGSARGYRVAGSALSERNTMEEPGRIAVETVPLKLTRHVVDTPVPGLSCLLIEVR